MRTFASSVSLSCFNPSNGFVCLRTTYAHPRYGDITMFQSVERICVPSNRCRRTVVRLGRNGVVSIRRTDLCAFELVGAGLVDVCSAVFQSVERICVPSNTEQARELRDLLHVSIRRTDLCAFEPLRAGQCPRLIYVSIRRTDLCAFERALIQALPESHLVSIRRTDLCAFERHRSGAGGRRCVRVSIRRTDLCAFERRVSGRCSSATARFNPSNGFVCLRTMLGAGGRVFPHVGFNPSNGFVCLRTAMPFLLKE